MYAPDKDFKRWQFGGALHRKGSEGMVKATRHRAPLRAISLLCGWSYAPTRVMRVVSSVIVLVVLCHSCWRIVRVVPIACADVVIVVAVVRLWGRPRCFAALSTSRAAGGGVRCAMTTRVAYTQCEKAGAR